MKKRIMSVLLVFAMMFSLVACTPNVKSYVKEVNKVSDWDGYTIDSKANIEIETKDSELNPFKFNIPMDLKGKAKGKNLIQMDMKMNLKPMKEVSEKMGEAIPANVPDEVTMKIFSTDKKVYIGKKFFTDMLGEDAPEEIKNLKEEYLAIPIGEDAMAGINAPESDKAQIEAMGKYLQSKEFEAEILNLVEKAFKDFKPTVDMKISGNTYTYNATIEELVKDFNLAAESFVKNSKEIEEPLSKILTSFGIPMTKEDLQEFVASYNKEEFEAGSAELVEMLKGSSISTKSTFNKDSYEEEIKLILNVSDLFKMTMTMDSNYKKDSKVEIKLPTSVKEITMMEYFEMLGGINSQQPSGPMTFVRVNGEDLYFEDQEPILKENRTLVPVRALLENIGAEVNWDQKAQKVIAKKDDMNIELTIGSKVAKVNGKEVQLDVPAEVLNNRTMIPLRFISENLGYKVKFDNSMSPIYIVDIYNISDEELDKKVNVEVEDIFAEEKAEQIAKEAEEAVDAAADVAK